MQKFLKLFVILTLTILAQQGLRTPTNFFVDIPKDIVVAYVESGGEDHFQEIPQIGCRQ